MNYDKINKLLREGTFEADFMEMVRRDNRASSTNVQMVNQWFEPTSTHKIIFNGRDN